MFLTNYSQLIFNSKKQYLPLAGKDTEFFSFMQIFIRFFYLSLKQGALFAQKRVIEPSKTMLKQCINGG